MSNLARAIEIAVEAHAGQKDRYGQPYVLHPLRLMMRAESDDERIVAVLHDVIEDNPTWTLDRLRAEGFSQPIVEAMDNITRRGKDEPYDAYITRTLQSALSRRVKLLDLRDNMDLTRILELDDEAVRRLHRYHAAWVRVSADQR